MLVYQRIEVTGRDDHIQRVLDRILQLTESLVGTDAVDDRSYGSAKAWKIKWGDQKDNEFFLDHTLGKLSIPSLPNNSDDGMKFAVRNSTIRTFFSEIIQPACKDLSVICDLSKENETLEDWLNLETATLLRKFVHLREQANPAADAIWNNLFPSRPNKKKPPSTILNWRDGFSKRPSLQSRRWKPL